MDFKSDFLLDPEITYLNHGAFGACPKPVFNTYQNWQRELERGPIEFLARRADERLLSSRKALGDYIGASAENLILLTNATTGINLVARSLNFKSGEEVIASDHEYGALNIMWEHLAKANGFSYRKITTRPYFDDPQEIVENFKNAITPETKALFVSHMSSETALILPVTELISLAKEHGLISIIDGAHVPGHIELDLKELNPDIYTGNCHKWLLSPKGSAFLYVAPELQDEMEGGIISWHFEEGFVRRHQYLGTRDISAFLAIPKAIDYVSSKSFQEAKQRATALTQKAYEEIPKLTGLSPLSTEDWFSQMVSLPFPSSDPEAIHDRLYQEFKVEVPLHYWKEQLLIRPSFQVYNSRSDLEQLLIALATILKS